MAVTKAEQMLLEGAGEEEFTKWVKGRARKYRWKGVHVRYSQGVVESIHSVLLDGYSEAYGVPDWLFWHEGMEQSFYAELKGAHGRESKGQKLEIPSLRKAGQWVFVWYPRDAVVVDNVFRDGVGAAA